jgi:membrane protein required for colicin V production
MDFSSLTYFDNFVIFVVIYSTFIAFFKGFIKTSTSFLSWIASTIGSFFIFPYVLPIVGNIIHNVLFANLAAGFGSYILCMTIISFINGKIIDLTVEVRGGAIDRTLGLGFGFLRGCLITCMIFHIVVLLSPVFMQQSDDDITYAQSPLPDMVKKAKTFNLLNSGSKLILAALPKNVIPDNLNLVKNKDKVDNVGGGLLENFINSAVGEPTKADNSNSSNQPTQQPAVNNPLMDNLNQYKQQIEKAGGKVPENVNIGDLETIMNELKQVKEAQ